jgi:hypothetical protein
VPVGPVYAEGLLGSLGAAPPSPTGSMASSTCSADRVWGLDQSQSTAAASAFKDKMATLVYDAIEGLVASGVQFSLLIVLIKPFSLHLHLTHQCTITAES